MRIGVLMAIGSPWAQSAVLYLSEAGHEVHVIDFANIHGATYLGDWANCISETGSKFSAAVSDVHLLKPLPSSLRYVGAAHSLRTVAKRCNIDVLLCLYAGGYALLTYLSGFRPYALYAVGSDVLFAQGVRRPLLRRAFRSAEIVFANGDYLAQKTQELAPEASVTSLLLGVDTERFVPIRRSHQNSPVRILCPRGFLPVYNNEYIIRALAQLPIDIPEFTVTFVAGGPLEKEVRMLADSTLSPNIRARLKFLGGVTQDQLVRELQESDICISVSRSDGTSSSVLEAMSCGLYPLLSDIPQNRAWVDGTNGAVVPFDAPSKFAAALASAIGDSDLRARAAAKNRQLILSKASSLRTMAVLSKHLENVVVRRGKLSSRVSAH